MVDNNSKVRSLPISYYDFIKEKCTYHNFPVGGVDFIDIFTLIRQAGLSEFNDFVRIFSEESDIILLPEARGFLFAQSFDMGKEVFLRKQGKLPGSDLHQITAPNEYSEAVLEFNESAIVQILNNYNLDKSRPVRVILFDDILATGNTAKAVYDYFSNLTIQGYSFDVQSCVFFMELSALKGREFLNKSTSVYSFLTYKP